MAKKATKAKPAAERDGLGHIVEDLRPLAQAIETLKRDPNNLRKHDDPDLAGLATSMQRYGIRKPCVVNRRSMIVEAGNGMVMVAQRLGWSHVPVVFVDDDEKSASGYALADNRTAELSQWDEARLQATIAELRQEDADLYNALMLAELEPEGAAPPADPDDQPPLVESYAVLVQCADEPDQTVVIEELERNGLPCRALMAGFPKVDTTPRPMPELQAGQVRVVRTSEVVQTARVKQLAGMFDLPPTAKQGLDITVDLPIDEKDWNIGLIVGPSGCGKSSVARQVFGDRVVQGFEWPADKSLLDGFPKAMKVAEITTLLSSVGFSSPPNWLVPYHVLSMGQQFRVTLARCLAEMPDLAVVDEFTSVVDRQVAKIGSAAVASAVRKSGKRLVAVACHYDIEEWLQPDWKLDLETRHFAWRSLRRRPPIQVSVERADKSIWGVFARYHYLSADLHPAAQCFVAKIDGRPAVFVAAIFNPHFAGGWWREHRTVCLPDYQGVGLGNRVSEAIAAAFVCNGHAYRSTTSNPAMIAHRYRSKLWRMIRAPGLISRPGRTSTIAATKAATNRNTCGFAYVGPADESAAVMLGVI